MMCPWTPSALALLSVLLGAIWSFVYLCRKSDRKQQPPPPPPGPAPLPIIGNLHLLGGLPHRALRELSKKYGPIMSMKLGFVPAIVVSSPEAAELFLKTHDAVFASRPKVQAAEYLSYGNKGMAFSEYGPYWRNLRKLCTLELLSVAKIDSYSDMRREEMGLLVQSLMEEYCEGGKVVDLSEKVEKLIEDWTCRMVFGRCNDERFDLKGVIQESLLLSGAFNIADFVAFLGPLDLQGWTRRLKANSKRIDKILSIFIDEHVQNAHGSKGHHKDFVDTLLSLMNNKSSSTHKELSYSIDRTNIKAIVFDMIVGAVDTSATAIEWIMSELLRHPRVMKRLQEELKNVVGEERLMVEEADLARLEYLEMVIKERLRLHPVAPLLVPHEAMEDVVVDEYFVPKKSRIIVNCWALGRDPNAWSDNPDEFFPERFIGSDVDLRGQHFQFIPFGSGRRSCPGTNLGLKNIRLVVAQLVHCFDWKLPDGMQPNDLDMSEKFGLSLPRAKHLLAIPSIRLRAWY